MVSVRWCVRGLSFHSNVYVTLIDLNFCTQICLDLSKEATSLVQYILDDVCHVCLLVCEASNCSVCCNFTVFTGMQDEVFYLNLALKYVRSS